ncbi:unnamed protein product [Litomosoides sigmodontis]|uniref:Uncharacterized protein n=1 Tax=Litomosoides sigmodontis TaxID=42156 RepID=A0A3P6VDN7_LITSI|nr:unnamed protein product [Litomosoides sigmodontis]
MGESSACEGIAKTEVDENYIKTLDWELLQLIVKLFAEAKLHNLRKDKTQLNSKDILDDLKSYRDDKLFRLLTTPDHSFEDNFTDQPVVVSYLRRKLAPQTVATHLGELITLLEADQVALQNLEVTQVEISAKTPTNTVTKSKVTELQSKK